MIFELEDQLKKVRINYIKKKIILRLRTMDGREIASIEGRISQDIILNSIIDIHYYKNTFLKEQSKKRNKNNYP